MGDEEMDVDVVLEKLNGALALQYRSVIQYTLAAGGVRGTQSLAVAEQLSRFGDAEYADTRLLIAKIVALGGQPTTDVATPTYHADVDAALANLVDAENETLAALHGVIPDTGQEPRSEALEHLLEHVIMRKQDQLDALLRALG